MQLPIKKKKIFHHVISHRHSHGSPVLVRTCKFCTKASAIWITNKRISSFMMACTSETPIQKLQGHLLFTRKYNTQKILDFIPASSKEDILSGWEDAWKIRDPSQLLHDWHHLTLFLQSVLTQVLFVLHFLTPHSSPIPGQSQALIPTVLTPRPK